MAGKILNEFEIKHDSGKKEIDPSLKNKTVERTERGSGDLKQSWEARKILLRNPRILLSISLRGYPVCFYFR